MPYKEGWGGVRVLNNSTQEGVPLEGDPLLCMHMVNNIAVGSLLGDVTHNVYYVPYKEGNSYCKRKRGVTELAPPGEASLPRGRWLRTPLF